MDTWTHRNRDKWTQRVMVTQTHRDRYKWTHEHTEM